MSEHEWECFGEWGTEKSGWSQSFRCKRCGQYKLSPTAHKLMPDGKRVEIPNEDTFKYDECDIALVRRIMES